MRRATAVLASAVLATAGTLAASAPASAATTASSFARMSAYVALGDSYSSGAGINPLVPSAPPSCSRSRLNYAHDIAAVTWTRSFTDVTCSGADTSDFTGSQGAQPPQLDAVTPGTRLVTMTIGGDDEGLFTTMLTDCAAASHADLATNSIFGAPCENTYRSTFADEVAGPVSQGIHDALTAVHQKAPNATVVIIGYPRILPETGVPACYPAMPFSMGDVPYMSAVETQLNGVIQQAAADTGSRFVDMAPSSLGHDACRGPLQRWVEPVFGSINAFPAHPNAFGEWAMAAQTLQQLGR